MTDYEQPMLQPVYFVDCTCEHEKDEHGWGSCNVPDCSCEGGWEE